MEFATMPPMPGERELLSGRMTWMRKLVADIQFFGVEWHKGTERDSGKLFRLDGQHSSRMLAEIEAANFPAGLQATITSWEFDHNDRAQIFDYYNNPKSVRNSRDVMGVYRAEHEDLLNVSRDMLVKAANGLKSYYMSVENGVIYTTRKRGLYWNEPQHRDFARWINSFDAR
jgi:hypothetical protein